MTLKILITGMQAAVGGYTHTLGYAVADRQDTKFVVAGRGHSFFWVPINDGGVYQECQPSRVEKYPPPSEEGESLFKKHDNLLM